MRNSRNFVLVATAVAAMLAAGCGKPSSPAIDPVQLGMFAPLPDSFPPKADALTEEKIGLGRMLYYDTRLSKNQTLSCNSCHLLNNYGVDGHPTSDGHKGRKGDRNSPTVYNAAGHFVQFWDGRAADVEEQAKGPVMNPVEMAMPGEKQVLAVLNSMPEYVAAFRKAFPEDKNPVTYDNMGRAIGAFERKLVTPSRWDRFLQGNQTALTDEEKAGFNAFLAAGCQTCHSGALLGGHMYQKLGLVKPYPDASDPGRAKVTNSDADKMIFKVPALRNIEKTGPYFHSGKVPALEQAVAEMSDYQLGKPLSPADAKRIVAFLRTLTGDVPADYVKEPALPKSTVRTPKPDPTD
ncbi:MAG: c-type cytochrome [Acidobacteria bacterium]|nr:c-type cytochrome [Acidobacteriota bacterium]